MQPISKIQDVGNLGKNVGGLPMLGRKQQSIFMKNTTPQILVTTYFQLFINASVSGRRLTVFGKKIIIGSDMFRNGHNNILGNKVPSLF